MDNKTHARMRHFYLYAKHHYKASDDVMADLKVIYDDFVGHDCGEERDIMHWLLKLGYLHIKSERDFSEFMNDIHPMNAFRVGCSSPGFMQPSEDPYWTRVARAILSRLFNTTVNEIDFDLGEPDESLLPLRFKQEFIDEMNEIGFEYDGDSTFTHNYQYEYTIAGPTTAFVCVDWINRTAKAYDDTEEDNEEVWHYANLYDAIRNIKEIAESGTFDIRQS